MKENRKDDENPIVIYTSQDGQVHVNVRIEDETAWLIKRFNAPSQTRSNQASPSAPNPSDISKRQK